MDSLRTGPGLNISASGELTTSPSRTVFSSVQFSRSVVSDCDPMNRSTLGLPVRHQLPEFTQTHVHQVGDAIQPSHPLSSPSPPAFNLSQHQGLFSESALRIRWPKYWSFSFSISPSISCGTLGRSCDHNPYRPSAGGSTFCPGVLSAPDKSLSETSNSA